MELSFKELAKRDVINVADGKCLGRICDLRLSFPSGELSGIVVPGKKTKWFLRCFDKCSLFIDQSKIMKIGGDVILVNLKCGEVCSPSSSLTERKTQQKQTNNNAPISCTPSPPPCPPACPPCTPQCTPNCSTQCPPTCNPVSPTCEDLFRGIDSRIDLSDY